MNAIFILIRLPIFLIGFALLTAWSILSIPIYFVFKLFFQPFFWIILFLPLNFLKAAFKNDINVFTSFITSSIKKWGEQIKEMLGDYEKSYKSLGSWLMHGSK
jgi:hypothetical protein